MRRGTGRRQKDAGPGTPGAPLAVLLSRTHVGDRLPGTAARA
ncbi:hypothetical protein [Streptomyces poriferorum]|nr:hypothetical protein [Streptomyces poriferorum]